MRPLTTDSSSRQRRYPALLTRREIRRLTAHRPYLRERYADYEPCAECKFMLPSHGRKFHEAWCRRDHQLHPREWSAWRGATYRRARRPS